MHSKIIPLFFIVASLTSTSLGLHHLVVTARRSLGILARQTNSTPCATICNTVESTVNACTTTSCICSSATAASVQACVNCGVEADPTASGIATAENLVNAFENACSSVPGAPTVTINTNVGSTLNTATLPIAGTSTAIIPSTAFLPSTANVPTSTISQIIIGPSSAPSIASNVGSTSTASAGGLPLKSSALPNKIILHWTVALLGLAAGNLLLLVF